MELIFLVWVVVLTGPGKVHRTGTVEPVRCQLLRGTLATWHSHIESRMVWSRGHRLHPLRVALGGTWGCGQFGGVWRGWVLSTEVGGLWGEGGPTPLRPHLYLRCRPPHDLLQLPFLPSGRSSPSPPPLCDIPSGCCFFTGPWTVTRSSLRMLRRVAVFCRPLRPVLLLVSFPRSRSPVVGVLGLR